MRPTRVPRRLLSALLMAVAAIAQSGDALAHGMAHHHEAEHHASSGHHEADHHDSTEHLESLAVSNPDHGHDHGHGNVDDASVRNRVEPQAAPHDVELPEPTMREVTVESPAARAPFSPGDRSTGPPPRLRAPPIR